MNSSEKTFPRDLQYYKFCLYGFLKNQKFFEPFIVLFFRDAGLSFLAIGVLYSIREVAQNVLEIPTGIFADSYGRRRSMIFGFAAYIFSFIMFSLVENFFLYACAMVLFALGEALRSGTHKALILEHLRINGRLEHKVNYYGHTRSWSQIGSAISALVAAALVYYSGFRIVFAGSVFPYILGLILMLSYPKELDGEFPGKIKSLPSFRLQVKATLFEIKKLFSSHQALRAIGNASIFEGLFKTVKDYLQPIVRQYALFIPVLLTLQPEKRVSLLIGIVYTIIYLGAALAARNSGRFPGLCRSLPRAVNSAYLTGVLLVLFSGIALVYLSLEISLLLFVFFYMVKNIKKPMDVGCVSELISQEIMATGLSGQAQLRTIIVAIVSPLMGLLADQIGVGGGLIILALLTVALFPLVALNSEKDTGC